MFVVHNYLSMEFVDRVEEYKRLKALLDADKPAFVVVRGRRRIGKSALVARVLKPEDIYYEADRSAMSNQIASFASVVAETSEEALFTYNSITPVISKVPLLSSFSPA